MAGAGANHAIALLYGHANLSINAKECILLIPSLNSQLDLGFVGYNQGTMGE